MDVVVEPEDTHPSGLKPVARHPVCCPKKDVMHRTDDLKELHGTPSNPIVVPEESGAKYVQWEYKQILRKMPTPYHKCLQELLIEESTDRSFDRIVVRDIRGKHHVFYFDVTARLAEQTARMVKASEDYEAGRPIDPKDRDAIETAIRVQKEAKRRNRESN